MLYHNCLHLISKSTGPRRVRWHTCAVLGVALVALAACGAAEDGGPCSSDADCIAGTACHTASGQCLAQSAASPSLVVLPPSNNKMGWVDHEYPSPILSADGRLRLQLKAGVSLQGRVYASSNPKESVLAQVVAWRDSLIPGQPKVQTEATAVARSNGGSGGGDTYAMWLAPGHSYTFYVAPMSPDDSDYPPRVVSGLRIDTHTRRDFVLEGPEMSVAVKGRVLDANGVALPESVAVAGQSGPMPTRMSVRAYEQDGLLRSSRGETYVNDGKATKPPAPSPRAGEFTIRVPSSLTVPATGRTYSIKFEPTAGGLPMPTVQCTDVVLGAFSGAKAEQHLGDLYLPPFRMPEKYVLKVRGPDGKAVPGASVTFKTTIAEVPKNAAFSSCSASFERTTTTDSTGRATVLLLPGSDKHNQKYAVTVVAPQSSPYANSRVDSVEVGPSGGVLADVVLQTRHRYTGRVTNASGAPVAGATIEAQGVSEMGAPPPGRTSATTAADGSFALHVEKGVYHLDVTPPAGAPLPAFGLRNKRIDGDLDNLLLRVPAGRLLVGEVRDPTGARLGRAKVQVYELVNISASAMRAEPRQSDITAPDGRFALILPASN